MINYQEQNKKKLLQKGDKVVLTVSLLDHPITINEIHAFQLGLVGFLFGIASTSDDGLLQQPFDSGVDDVTLAAVYPETDLNKLRNRRWLSR